jgi:hypothetical protein
MSAEKRRDRRYRFSVRVVLSGRPKDVEARTDDVSFKGVFVATEQLPPERQLIRLQFQLPTEQAPLNVMGMVTRRRLGGAGRAAGMGVSFFGLGEGEQARWNRFIQFVAASYRLGAQEHTVVPGAPAPSRSGSGLAA